MLPGGRGNIFETFMSYGPPYWGVMNGLGRTGNKNLGQLLQFMKEYGLYLYYFRIHLTSLGTLMCLLYSGLDSINSPVAVGQRFAFH